MAYTVPGQHDLDDTLTSSWARSAIVPCEPASAQERLGDGALGALAGVLDGGPIGLVAGGVVGYTAGPAIASSWGVRGQRHYRRTHYRRHDQH
jgi:hypothetical protein